MKKIIIIILCIFFGISYLNSQSVEPIIQKVYFSYDDNGNRIKRITMIVEVEPHSINFEDSIVVIDYEYNIMKNTELQIENNFDNSIIKIFPNPTSEILNFDIQTSIKSDFNNVEIYSTSGQYVIKEKCYSNYFQINISELKNGVYIVFIKSGNLTYKQKIIKQ